MIRLATDVGGTFTDLVGYDEASGRLFTAKTLTTPADRSDGVLAAIDAARAHGLDPSAVAFFAHGGTTVINAVTERKGARTALVTTRGFRDVLAIGRGNRPDLYNLRFRSPEPFVPRRLRFEVTERLGARGEVVTPLDEAEIGGIVEACRRLGVEAVGVVFLHSYANPAHEARCAALLREALPDAAVCASHEVSRQWREYERSNTVALSAFVKPVIERYLGRLSRALIEKGIGEPHFAMTSNGGLSTFAEAAASPLTLVESGPAGGVAGAVRVGAALGAADVLHLDVGGTTAKCSLIRDGKPRLDQAYKLEHSRTNPGYPVQVPVVDIVEIGAGGGSIAWIDERGGLRIGPHSAGADPGPACYGLGGTEPTVTDAKLVAGVLSAESFGEAIGLDPAGAETAVATLGRRLAITAEAAALAILDVAEAAMINALKLVTVQRGHDPRDLLLVVSGGAGPMLGARLGRELKARAVAIPPHPGIFSAWGMLAARPRVDLRQTWFSAFGEAPFAELAGRMAALEAEASATFGARGTGISFVHTVEMRYEGQEHSVAAPWSPTMTSDEFLAGFHAAHERAYTFSLAWAAAQITGLHVTAELETDVAALPGAPAGADVSATGVVPVATRRVWLSGEGPQDCPLYRRAAMPAACVIDGPALVEEATSTTLVLQGQTLRVDPSGILVITERAPR